MPPLTPDPLRITESRSVIAPLTIAGLPAGVEALGQRWLRKSEFHLTAVAERALDLGPPRLRRAVERLGRGRALGPVTVTPDVRRVSHPDRPELRTLIVMVECHGLATFYRELSVELGIELEPPPAHVTLYSSDPNVGIGIIDARELIARAPPLRREQQHAVREAIRFGEVFGL